MTDLLPSPDALSFRFHQFRPSDRDELRRVARLPGGDAVFVAALAHYLDGWAQRDWLQDDDIEVVAEWCVIHTSHLLPALTAMATSRRGGSGQSELVFGLFLTSLDSFEAAGLGQSTNHTDSGRLTA